MIIQNGTIQIKMKQAAGIDPVTGFPIKPTGEAYSPAIPCQYYANQYNNIGQTNGESFTIAHYTILIEEQPTKFTGEQIRLENTEGNIIGDYSVISVEVLKAVSEVRITV